MTDDETREFLDAVVVPDYAKKFGVDRAWVQENVTLDQLVAHAEKMASQALADLPRHERRRLGRRRK